MIETKWENLPWFAVIGVLPILSLFLYCMTLSNFWTLLVPTYFTEALVLITIGYTFYKGHTKQSWIVFLMSLIWFLNQLFSLVMWNTTISPLLWLMFLAQIGLTYLFFTGKTVKFLNPTKPASRVWTYSALFVIAFYAFAKFTSNLMAYIGLWGTWIPPIQYAGWGFAILLTSLGYLFPKYEYSGYMKLLGVLIAAFSAFTIGTAGLTLLGH